jgi:hypothetical protein
MKGRDNSEELRVDKIIIKWVFWKQHGNLWNGCIWLRTGTSGRLF